jgi:deoxyribonuclease-4
MPRWLRNIGLSAYEYQCSRGVNIKEETARRLGEAARENGITLSIHGPYYINLATPDPEKREKTRGHLMKSLQAAQWMGATKVVFHPGGPSGMERSEALERAVQTLSEIVLDAREKGLGDILLAPETMGKASLLGTVEEIIELCRIGPSVVPTVDFGHLHAVTGGGLKAKEDFELILDKFASCIPKEAFNSLHIHFSPVEYTGAGEKRHRTLLDEGYGPPFEPLAELIEERKMNPVIICESAGRQAEDALEYQEIYRRITDEK